MSVKSVTSLLPHSLRYFRNTALTSCVCFQQQREFRSSSFVVRPPTRRPWWVRKWSLKKDNNLTPENEDFVKDIITEKYTAPSPLREAPWERHPYVKGTRRSGVLALKLGTIKQWTKDGNGFLVTLLQVLDNHVINYVPPELYATYPSHQPWHAERFGLQVVGALSTDPRMFSKQYNNLFAKAGVPPKKWLTRFLVSPDAAIQPGTALSVNHYRVGDFVDVQGRTRDWGFQGVMRRHGMKGGPATHGVTKSHRRLGSIGGGGDKDGVWKGKKMPGMMGNKLSTQCGLKIWRINYKYNVLYVHGMGVPGLPHTFVRVYDSRIPKCRINPEKNVEGVPMPTWYPEDAVDTAPDQVLHEELFNMDDPSIQAT